MSAQQHTHVKVARYALLPTGEEIIAPLDKGGEAQIWDLTQWGRYHQFVEDNPQVRGTREYPWTFIEYVTPGTSEIQAVPLPEVTAGKEFRINPSITNNAKN